MRLQLLIVSCLCLTGCSGNTAKPDSGYGNFIINVPSTHERQIADDVIRQLVALYPPATTRLDLEQATPDMFGTQLVDQLRGQGYALQERALAPGASQSDSPSAPEKPKASESFNYVLDRIFSPNLYRVTLKVGNQAMSRAYIVQHDLLHPAGAWARKE